MSVWAVLRIAVRRWFVALPMLALTALAIMRVPADVAAAYPATESLVLQGPLHVNVPKYSGTRVVGETSAPVNPALRAADHRLAPSAADLVVVETSPAARQAVARAGLEPSYSVTLGGGSYSVFVLTVETMSREKSLRTLDFVTQRIRDEVSAAGATTRDELSQRVSVNVLEAPAIVPLERSTPYRKDATLAFLGFILACSAAVVFDNLVRRYRRRSRRARWRGADLPAA